MVKINEALKAYQVDEKCGELFVCSIHRNRLVDRLGEYKQVFKDVLRLAIHAL